MKILVCGGRNFGYVVRTKPLPENEPSYVQERLREYRYIFDCLNEFTFDYLDKEGMLPEVEIISGGATGVDSVAIDWAVVNWCPYKEYKADWNRFGRGAGPIRNKQMLDEGKPDVVLAFPGGKGTANMKSLAKLAGVLVIEYTYNGD